MNERLTLQFLEDLLRDKVGETLLESELMNSIDEEAVKLYNGVTNKVLAENSVSNFEFLCLRELKENGYITESEYAGLKEYINLGEITVEDFINFKSESNPYEKLVIGFGVANALVKA